jgi:3-hydroxypropanoate dehydrogenase
MHASLDQPALDQLFRTARTYNDWQDIPVSDDRLRSLYDLFKWGPTSANSNPARFVWVRSPGRQGAAGSRRGGDEPGGRFLLRR